MQDAKEEVRARLAIEDVVGEYVQLKRAGRNFKGLSPFTDERTPSFVVSPDKQIWHDFSSGKGGDVFSFVMLMEGMEFRACLEHLARKAGVELGQFGSGDGELTKRKERARQALTLAGRYFQQVLVRSPEAIDYVTKQRGLTRQTIEEFSIGYAERGRRALVDALKKRGFSESELKDAGLVNQYGGDLFRGRMTVALMDGSGGIIGFTGRVLGGDTDGPKYLNTPQTILFDKGRHVFGLSQAKEAIRREGVVVIVEGNLDVVSSHQAGVKHVVATAGTAMTEYHIKTLARLADRIRLAFDGDAAGLAATERAIGLAQTAGVELEVVSLPGSAKDPDELIQQDPALWWQAIDQAAPAVEWVIEQYKARENMSSAEGKRRFTTASLALVRQLKDPVERDHYISRIQKITGSSMAALEAKLTAPTETNAPRLKRATAVTREPAQTPGADLEGAALGIALLSPASRRWLAALEREMVADDTAWELLQYLQHSTAILSDTVPKELQNIGEYVKIVQLKSDTRYANWDDDQLQAEMARVMKQITIKHREIKKQQLIDQLRDAETVGDDAKAEALRRDINALIREKM